MRTILLSLTTVFVISITGCLDDAQQPEPDHLVLTAEPTEVLQHPVQRPEAPLATPSGVSEDTRVADPAPQDIEDPMHCDTVKACADGYVCRIAIQRCVIDPDATGE